MTRRGWAGAALLLGLAPTHSPGQRGAPLLRVDPGGPAVVALWAAPPEGLIDTDEGLASLYDDFMVYWAESARPLERLGVARYAEPVPWAHRQAVLRAGDRCWLVRLPGEVGYLVLHPGRPPRLLDGLLMDEELQAAVVKVGAGEPPGKPLPPAPCPDGR